MTEMELWRCNAMKGEAVKLMVQCEVGLSDPMGAVIEVRRGMTVLCAEGIEVGKVAAVAVDPGGQHAPCLILGHLPEKERYHALPVSWVGRAEGDVIFLKVCFEDILELTEWHAA